MDELHRRISRLESRMQAEDAQPSCLLVYQYLHESTEDALLAEGHVHELPEHTVVVAIRRGKPRPVDRNG